MQARKYPFDETLYPECARGHDYALDVVSKKIRASKYVIGACERYLRDVVDTSKEWYFEPRAAEKYLRLVQKFDHVNGNWKTPKVRYEPWQCWVWMNIMGFLVRKTKFRRFRVAHVEIARGNGKALCLDTDIPTPDRGLVKFGTLNVGDLVYGSDGTICRITGKNEVHRPKAYRVTFSDGTWVDCSSNHLWVTSDRNERRRKTKSVKTTQKIFETLRAGKESNHSIEVAKPVSGSRTDCQLGYVLGYWLGDGHSSHGRFTAHIDQFEEIVSRFKSRKLDVKIRKVRGKAVSFTVPALTYWLKELGLLHNKHIPEKYFQAPESVRRELLRGLMDSDGTVSKEIGNFTFTNVNEKLARGTRRLIASLGYKATLRKKATHCQNGFVGQCFDVTFSTPNTRPSIFGIRAKEDKRTTRPQYYSNKRYIVDVEKIPKKDMFCIEVDSEDNTFLITDQYIPTHNSLMASQCALYLLCLDNPNGNQISTVATKKEQARIVLDAARAMADKNKSFKRSKGVAVLAHSIVHKESHSVIRALSAEASSLDGLNDVLAVCDELHAMRKDTFEVISSGMSKRSDSLTLCITTAGFNIDSIGYSQSGYAKKVCLGEVDDDQFFAAVYCLDNEDDWDKEECWIMANPNLDVSVPSESLRAKVKKALETPQDINNLKVKHMNVWISQADAYYDLNAWDACADTSLKLEQFIGKECKMGLDLANNVDLCSQGIIFRDKDGVYTIFDKSFIPEETVAKAKNSLYDQCAQTGHLLVTKGAAINYDDFREDVLKSSKLYKVTECGYDAWNATEMAQKLSDKIEMVKVQMNVANLSEPMKKLNSLMREGKLRHCGSPLFRWCLGNVVAKEDHNGNVYPRKPHIKLKIDPVIAVLIALALWLQDEMKESVYETRGVIIL